ncbi:hypothetical protein ACWCQZ_51105, partial [Streptomyces sp. NPDC002285]
MLTVVNTGRTTSGGASLLDEIVREGARRMLAAALEAEVNSYIAELDRVLCGEADEAFVAAQCCGEAEEGQVVAGMA